MRATAPPLLPIFRSQLQGELLALVLADPARQWTIDELAERTGEPYQTVATEVRRLQEAELLEATTVGRTKLLSANQTNPYLRPLSQLATMAFGPPIVIGRPDRDEVYDAARRAQERLGREVNVTQRTRKHWDTATDGFSEQVRSSPMVEVPYPRSHDAVEQGQ